MKPVLPVALHSVAMQPISIQTVAMQPIVPDGKPSGMKPIKMISVKQSKKESNYLKSITNRPKFEPTETNLTEPIGMKKAVISRIIYPQLDLFEEEAPDLSYLKLKIRQQA